MQTSGAMCREIAESYPLVIPAKAGIQYSRGGHDSNDRPRRTGYPAFAGMTLALWRRLECSVHYADKGAPP